MWPLPLPVWALQPLCASHRALGAADGHWSSSRGPLAGAIVSRQAQALPGLAHFRHQGWNLKPLDSAG